MKKNLSIISTYSFGHFYVDFICAFVLSLIIFQNTNNVSAIASLIVTYNVLAFGTQPFFGFLIDHYKKPKFGAIVGLVISTMGLLLFSKPYFAAIILGLGNAIYHVGGGVVALNLDPSKAKYPGIYVAPGALGLFLGGLLGYLQITPWLFISIGLLISFVLIALIQKISIPKLQKFKEKNVNLIGAVLLLLLVSVCMRVLIGYSLNLEWKSLFVLGLLLTTAIASGKFFGGIIADRYGFMNVGMIGLLIAAPLLIFSQEIPILLFIGAFCFNLVMPITLTAIAEAIPNYKGVAFGLTTLSLAIGYLLFISLKGHILIGKLFTTIVIIINLGSLYLGLKKYGGMKQ